MLMRDALAIPSSDGTKENESMRRPSPFLGRWGGGAKTLICQRLSSRCVILVPTGILHTLGTYVSRGLAGIRETDPDTFQRKARTLLTPT